MGHPSSIETQGNNEGSLAPLPPTKATLRAWMPILRKVTAVTLGGLGLAGIGALSMAQTPAEHSPTPASSSPAFANMVSPTEWLAPSPAPATSSTATPPDVLTEQPVPSPPCPPTPGSVTAAATSASSRPGILPDGRVVLNLATSAELTTLPGVGPKRAEAILALRTRLKGFRKLSDLLRVKGIGVKSLRKLEPKLVLDVPKEPD